MLPRAGPGGLVAGWAAGTLTNALSTLIGVSASVLSELLSTEPWPLTVTTDAVLTARMPSWVWLGWVLSR